VAAVVLDERMIVAAREGRPEITARCRPAVDWLGERRDGARSAFGVGAALTAGAFSRDNIR
jgi:hypothetical protein